jgi:7-keto-8-aminopelargonate synthetase-like enzyme
MAAEKLDIKRVLKAVDSKNYDFYDNLTDDEKKAFSPFILMRYTSNVQGDREIQEWFVETTNEYVNKDYMVLSKNHKALQWKLYAATGAGVSTYHPYLASGKKEKANKVEKLLAELYPATKMAEIKMMAAMMTKDDITELFDKMGFDKKQRKEYE